MRTLVLPLLLLVPALSPVSIVKAAEEFALHTFARQQLTDVYFSEGASTGDINQDGIADIVYGPYWFAGPDFKTKHEIYQPVPQNMNRYADHFFSWVHDFNRDGWNDVLVVGFPGTAAYVYENPQAAGLGQHWKKHPVFDWVSNESPQFVDLLGDETPELVCTRDGFFGFVTIDPADVWQGWEFHPISEQVTDKRFGHGLGIGDVNGDGRSDIIHPGGWYEQPADQPKTTRWKHHAAKLAAGYGGAEMHAYDVDGDGDNDIITSDAAHEFGLSWYEQVRDGDEITFQPHQIMGAHPSENKYGVRFSELHSVALTDIDGDGLKDIVTGKTYWSHHRQSPLWDAGAVVYWFQLVRGPAGGASTEGSATRVDWVPRQIDGEAGIGRQICVADVTTNGLPDIIVGGMKGAHVLKHSRSVVTKEQWRAAQPKPVTISDPAATASDPAATATSQPRRGPQARVVSTSGKVVGAIEAESLTNAATAGSSRPQNMASFSADKWSGNSQLWWTGARPGDELAIELPDFNGPVDLELVLTCAPDYAIVQLSLDDKPLGDPIDLYENKVVTTGVLTFPQLATKGNQHQLGVRIIGANPQAKPAYMVGVDHLRIKTANGRYLAAKVTNAAVGPTLKPDEYPHAGLNAAQAAEAMQVPAGFSVTVGASEPAVKQPIAMAIDDRGRVWIAEAYEYPIRAPGDTGRDRILIFEDTDGDGTLDERKVFAEGLNLVSGLEVGFGGVWVGAAPYLMFIPDQDGDDVPDREPQILLDGWGLQDTHETLNAFCWGPDGWLYGCHGVFTHSVVGKPGTARDQRVRLNCGVWRYHPIKHQFEVFAHGTSNPWGVDFNDHGQAFITACVIPHLYHVIQGARYQRQGGQHFNPHTYQDIVTIADHLHYLGAKPHDGNSKSDSAGGGHAHAGAMIYLGDAWPPQYRNQLFMNNIHGQRLNVDILVADGSGYIGKHGPDFLLTGDQASQILNLRYGPDGNAWMIDWYDMQACHHRDVNLHDRENGRIYKIRYGDAATRAASVDLTRKSDGELAALVLAGNDWYVRHSRRLLQERSAQRAIDGAAIDILREIATTHADDTRRLRAIWALHVTGNLNDQTIDALLADASPYVRGWAIQLAMERSDDQPPPALRNRFVELAKSDDSPVTRLYLASAAQRLPLDQRWDLLAALTAHAADADDHNLPWMYWYAAEPLADEDATRAVAWAMSAGEQIPVLREFMLRRIGGSNTEFALAVLIDGLKNANHRDLQLSYLRALGGALKGQRQVAAPTNWTEIAASLLAGSDDEVTMQTLALSVAFGDPAAVESMRAIVTDAGATPERRTLALQSLLDSKDGQLVPTLVGLLSDHDSVREMAIGGLALYDDPRIAPALLRAYPQLTPEQQRRALGTLCARSSSGRELLQAIAAKQVPGTDLTADLVRQLQVFKDQQIDQLLRTLWGSARATASDKLNLIAEYKSLVESNSLPPVDLELGRAVFAKTCQKCHVLYGVGYKIGPDLTGSNRSDLDYLLNNIVDPSAVMAKEYLPTIVLTIDGRVVSGLLSAEDQNSVTIQTTDALVVVPVDEIEQRTVGDQSMMPDDQLKQFSPHEVRSLFAYLRGKAQSPLLATPENVSTLFNGRDLTGWAGSDELWSVEDGELVGRTTGLKQNAWIVSDLAAADFQLTMEVKLVENRGNSGIQFRSKSDHGTVAGYQADIGKGWWGKLYEEHGRGLLWKQSGESHVKVGDWNKYEVIAEGHHIRTFINGQLCVDLEDPDGASRGIIALQLHSGGPTEVRFRNLNLTLLGPPSNSGQ
jgi:putative membrane-bound dehydrogenase-like protein